MLVNATRILKEAHAGHYAVGHFNINNLEWTKAILLEAEALKSPVILGVSEGPCHHRHQYGCCQVHGRIQSGFRHGSRFGRIA